MTAFFCDPHHLLIIIGVLILALLLANVGTGLKGVIGPALKKFLGKGDVTVNIQGGEMAENPKRPEYQGPACSFDPKDCKSHEAEHERSIRNEAGIAEIKKEFRDYKELFFKKLDALETGQQKILLAMVASGAIRKEHIPEI